MVVKMFANRKPTTASSLSAVNIVVAEFVILAPFDSKSCAICPPYKAIAIATAKPAVAPLLAAYDLILDARTFLFVPPAPSSIINKSASTMSAPISVPPSISNAVRLTLFAVEIVASLVSAMAAPDATLAFTTALAAS